MSLGLMFCFLLLCVVVLGIMFYLLTKEFFVVYRGVAIFKGSEILEHIVREIVTKSAILAVGDIAGTELQGDEKIAAVIEKASAISADVLLQHNIEPRNYDLTALVRIELFRINRGQEK